MLVFGVKMVFVSLSISLVMHGLSLSTFSHLVLNQPAHIYMGYIFWTHSHTSNTPARRQWRDIDTTMITEYYALCSLLIHTRHPLICSNLIRPNPIGNCNRSCVKMSFTYSNWLFLNLSFKHSLLMLISWVFLVLFCFVCHTNGIYFGLATFC